LSSRGPFAAGGPGQLPPLPPLNPALPKWVFGSLTQELIDSLTQKFDQESTDAEIWPGKHWRRNLTRR